MRISLRRLMLHVTVICLTLGAIATFPDAVENAVGGSLYTAQLVMQAILSTTLIAAPLLAAGALVSLFSTRPRRCLVFAGLGALVGCMFSPAISANLAELSLLPYGFRPSWVSPRFLADAIPPALGALAIGGLDFIIPTRRRTRTKSEQITI